MADLEADDAERDLSKHDKLVNAWIAAGGDANVETVASLTGASQSYASQVRQAMEEGDLSEAEVEEATVATLVDRYERRLEERAGDGASGSPGGATRGASAPAERNRQSGQPPGGHQAPPPRAPAGPAEAPPQPPGRGGEPPRPPRQGSTTGRSDRARIEAEDGLYVPVRFLREIDETLAVLEDEARFEVQNVPPQQPQRQVALAKLYVAQQARALVGDAADEAVPADEV